MRSIWLLVVALSAGCGAKTGLYVWGDGEPIDGGGGASGGNGGGGDTGDSGVDAPNCSDESYVLTPLPTELEVTVVVDSSGSMLDLTASGETKRAAVNQAIEQFLLAPNSAGIGASISFFPVIRDNIPSQCTFDRSCGGTNSCRTGAACTGTGKFCRTDLDCGSFGLGSCQRFDYCEARTACQLSNYTPNPPATLPGGAAALIDLLEQHQAQGATPTRPALDGAVQAATKRLERFPSKKPIVLLATDGLPTACDPAIPGPNVESSEGIPKVVSVARRGLDAGVATYVIGVFTPDQEALARNNLDSIARAGGTSTAFLITTDQNVQQRFLKAMNDIREIASECSFALPDIDTSRMVPRVTGPNVTWWLEQRDSIAQCDPVSGGYVQTAQRLELCPAVCGLLRSDPAYTLEIVAECKR